MKILLFPDRCKPFLRASNHFHVIGNSSGVIGSEEMLLQKFQYIHNNPVRRGYVEDPVHPRYSSVRVYAGKCGLIVLTGLRES